MRELHPMRGFHVVSVIVHAVALPLFIWVASRYQSPEFLGFAGWSAFWGAWSLTALCRKGVKRP